MNCCVAPMAIEGATGVSAIDKRTAGLTVNVALPDCPPKLAPSTLLPTLTPVASPPLALTLATAGVAEVQADAVVTSCDEPSAYLATAVNCTVPATGKAAVAGVTVTLVSATSGSAGLTVSVALPDLPPKLALSTLLPALTPVASPPLALTLATAGVAEVQADAVVTSCDDPSA